MGYPLRLIAGVLTIGMLLPNASAGKRYLLISDPQSSSKAVTLLEQTLIEQLQLNDDLEVSLPIESSPKQARANRLRSQAESLRTNARRQFNELELDVAVKQYSKAVQKLDKSMAFNSDIRPLTDSLTMLAATYLLLGLDRKARTTLERLLILDLASKPDQSIFNPQMMTVFDGVVSRIRATPSFDLEIVVDPPGAAVFFDGKLAGIAPVTVPNVRRGRHYVLSSLKGFGAVGRVVDVKPRSSHSISLRLSETGRDNKSNKRAAASLATIEQESISNDTRALAELFKADTALLLRTDDTETELVAFAVDGSNRVTAKTNVRVRDMGSANAAARELIAPLALRTNKEGGRSSNTEIAATSVESEKYSDGFGNNSDGQPSKSSNTEVAVVPDSTDGTAFQQSGQGSNKKGLLYATYGVGAALAATGGIFGYLALAKKQEFYRETKLQGGKTDHGATTDQVEGVAVMESGQTFALVADVLYSLGAIAAAIGLVMQVTSEEPTSSNQGTNPSDGSTPPNSGGWGLTAGPGFLRVDF